MDFRHAWLAMLDGQKVKRAGWKGYWEWEDNTIKMHLEDGRVIDILEMESVAYTFSNIAENDWVVEDGVISLYMSQIAP